jgi:hypothetical protein
MSQTKKTAKTDATEPKNAEGVDEQETAPEGEALNPEELAEVAGGQARHHQHPHHHGHQGHHPHHATAHHHAHHATAHHSKPEHHGHHHAHHHHNVRHAVPIIPGIKK